MAKFPYHFGLSQEDARSESRMNTAQRTVLCVASGGEVPLNVAALGACRVVACDTHPGQIALCHLKLSAALEMDGWEAAAFLGYRRSSPQQRVHVWQTLRDRLPPDVRQWWDERIAVMRKGVVFQGRFERFIKRLSWGGRLVFSKAAINGIFATDGQEQRAAYFDQQLLNRRLITLFRFFFHPSRFRSKALPAAAVRHQNAPVWKAFLDGFRTMCVETCPRRNYFLQLFLLGELRFNEALPEYLSPQGQTRLRSGQCEMEFRQGEIANSLQENESFDVVLLSNVCDWLAHAEYAALLAALEPHVAGNGCLFWRTLYSQATAAEFGLSGFQASCQIQCQDWERADRFPFYAFHFLRRA